jgi:hypothetical protein
MLIVFGHVNVRPKNVSNSVSRGKEHSDAQIKRRRHKNSLFSLPPPSPKSSALHYRNPYPRMVRQKTGSLSFIRLNVMHDPHPSRLIIIEPRHPFHLPISSLSRRSPASPLVPSAKQKRHRSGKTACAGNPCLPTCAATALTPELARHLFLVLDPKPGRGPV